MKTFQVSLQSAGTGCLVSVEGIGNARWLLTRLSREFVFKTSSPVWEDSNSAFCVFEISCIPPSSLSNLESILGRIPSVNLVDQEELTPKIQ